MSSNRDLEGGVSFVTARIVREAEVSGTPLSEGQLAVLRNLPTEAVYSWGLENMRPTPRNWDLERVWELCKIAYRSDRNRHAHSRNWEFALGVFALNNHPMRGLLQIAGVKLQRPKWDRLLLFVAGLLPLVGALVIAWNADRSILRLAVAVIVCVAAVGLMLLAFFASNRMARHRV